MKTYATSILTFAAVLLLVLQASSGCLAQCSNGSYHSPYGINIHAPAGGELTAVINEVQACGINWIRIDVNWFEIEPSKGNFSWSRYDAIVAAAQARGINVFGTLAYTPAWATSGSPQIGVPNNPQDWYNFVYQTVRRYNGQQGKGLVMHWGLWNEPNLDGFWQGTRQQYIDIILKNGANAVRAANPVARVVAPETARMDDWYYWLQDCIAQASSSIDVLSQHVYASDGYSTVRDRLEKSTLYGSDPSKWNLITPSIKEVLQYTGWFGQPFWVPETGFQSSTQGESGQAQFYSGFLNDWFTGNASRSWIHKVFFYEMNDHYAWPDIYWGIVRLAQGGIITRKEAFTTYKNFISSRPGASISSQDNFEGASLGRLHGQTSGSGWANSNTNPWSAIDSTDTRNKCDVVSGKYVKWGGLDSRTVSRSFNEAVWYGPIIYVELDYQIQADLIDDNNVYICKSSGDSVHFEFRANGDIRERGGGTVLGKWDGTDPRAQLNLKSGWKRIRIFIDLPGQKYDLHIGGATVGTNLPFRTASGQLDHIRFYRAKTGASDFSNGFIGIDNIKICNDVPVADTTAPSVPTGLQAAAQSETSVQLTWNASTDNIGILGYKVYRNGALAGTSITNSYLNTGLSAGTAYSYRVSAYDAAGNESSQSSQATVTTPDNTPPSVPSNVQASAETPRQVKVSWTASTDNVGVTGYKIFRNGGQEGTQAATSYSDNDLSPNTTYSYTVSAYDGAGNNSAQSSAAVITTMEAVDVDGAKGVADGVQVGMISQVVTAVFDGYFYLGAVERSAGIRVAPVQMPAGLVVGSIVDVGGTVQTVEGERCVNAAAVTVRS